MTRRSFPSSVVVQGRVQNGAFLVVQSQYADDTQRLQGFICTFSAYLCCATEFYSRTVIGHDDPTARWSLPPAAPCAKAQSDVRPSARHLVRGVSRRDRLRRAVVR